MNLRKFSSVYIRYKPIMSYSSSGDKECDCPKVLSDRYNVFWEIPTKRVGLSNFRAFFLLLNQIPKLQNQQLINDAMLQYCSHNANSLNREPSITFNDYCSIFNLRSGSLELHIAQTNAGQLVPIVMFFLTLYPM